MKGLLVGVLVVFVLAVAGLGSVATTVHAFDPLETACTGDGQDSDFCANKADDNNRTFVHGDNGIFVRIIQAVVIVTAAISVIMVIAGGFKYVVSAGDAGGTKQAKDTILYAIIGLLVAIFAQTIIAFVLSKLKT